MRRFSPVLALIVATAAIVPVLAVGCSDDDPEVAPGTDAGKDSSTGTPDTGGPAAPDTGTPGDDDDDDDDIVVVPDAGEDAGDDLDAGADADAAAPIADGGDAGDSGVDAGCANVAAAYSLSGTCNAPGFAPPKVLCVKQNQCALTAIDEFFGQTFTGTATNTGVTATTEAPVHQDCTGTVTSGKLSTLACTAPTVGLMCNATAAPLALKNATATCCSVTTQDCKAGERCQPVGNTQNVAVNACIPDRGTVDLNGACTRAGAAVTDIGDDDCKKGHFCANFGQATPATRVCRKLCTSNTDCTTGACFGFASAGSGLCIDRCKLDGTGTACAAGNTCRPLTSLSPTAGEVVDLRCDFIGTTADGGNCTASADCVAGSGCTGGKCAPICDTAHPCATGTCTKLTGTYAPTTEASTGFCKP